MIGEKNFYWVKHSTQPTKLLFEDRFGAGTHKYVTVTEGGLDACSLFQVLRNAPVLSCRSASSALSDCVGSWDYLNQYERIYLALDNDAQGRAATASIARLFDAAKVFDVRFSSNRKDANDYVQHGEDEELRNIWWNAKPYLPDTLIAITERSAKEILEKATQEGVPYPIRSLTKATYGIRTGETVLVTAQEKVGKTEFLHAIEYSLLRDTDAKVGAIFLEETPQRHLQALAGMQLERPIHLPDHRCKPSEAVRGLRELLKKDDRLFLYRHFGNTDPDVVVDTVRYLVAGCGCRYVLFDHISISCSGSPSEDERRTLDYLVTRLEMLVKELDFALIVVSHLNDEGKTRGSRWLTKTFDITINLDRNLNALDDYSRSITHVSIPYNRFCGVTGPICDIRFDSITQQYTEVVADGYPDYQAPPLVPDQGEVRQGEVLVNA